MQMFKDVVAIIGITLIIVNFILSFYGIIMNILSKVNRDGIDMKRLFTHDLSDFLPSEIVNYNENFLK